MDVQARTQQWKEAKDQFLATNQAQLRLAIIGIFNKAAYLATEEEDAMVDTLAGGRSGFNLDRSTNVLLGTTQFTFALALKEVKNDTFVFSLNLFGGGGLDELEELYRVPLLLTAHGALIVGSELEDNTYSLEYAPTFPI